MPDVTVEGATIHYETAGVGAPLVLLHGIGSNARSWRNQLTRLSPYFEVIAWDAPGYGRSSDPPSTEEPSMRFYARCLQRFLDALSLKRIFLLGHSMGGVIAQEFGRAFPDYLRALILADTRRVGSQAGLEERLTSIRSMTPSQLAEERAPKVLSRNASPDLIRQVKALMSEIRPAGYEFAAIALAASDTSDVLPALRVPALLIWGDEDNITPLWNEVPAGVQLKIISNAGHLCYIEQPERFDEVVRGFLLDTVADDVGRTL